LTIWQTVKKFKMNAFICMLVTFSAATDGYQIAYAWKTSPPPLED
jgi:hypothetical protein